MRRSVLVCAVLAALSACGTTDSLVSANDAQIIVVDEPPADDPSGGGTGPLDPGPIGEPLDEPLPEVPEGGFPLDPDKPEQDYDGYIAAVLRDLDTFWTQEMPGTYGFDYVPLEGGVFPVYPGNDGVPGCGTPTTTYRDIEGNAFYCQLGDFIAYDDNFLFPDLANRLGVSVIGVVMAHEWGHAIQERAGVFDSGNVPTVVTEMQADCFAGAWAAHLARGENPELPFGEAEIRVGVTGMLEVADTPGLVSEIDPSAHGSAFDRVSAFQEGFADGTAKCATYIEDPPETTLFLYNQFSDVSIEDQENAPYDDTALAEPVDPADEAIGNGIFQLIDFSLQQFWPDAVAETGATFSVPTRIAYPSEGPFPSCEGVADDQFTNNVFYCPSSNQVMYDDALGRELYNAVGDFSIAYLVANGWSDSVQASLGLDLSGEPRALMNDCLSGAWARSTVPTDDPNDAPRVTASPRDFEEVVRTALLVGDDTSTDDRIGSPFEKIEAFRTGLRGSPQTCIERFAS